MNLTVKDVITIFTVSFGLCVVAMNFIPDTHIQSLMVKFVDIGFIMWIELWKSIHHDIHSIWAKIKFRFHFRKKKVDSEKIKNLERCKIL